MLGPAGTFRRGESNGDGEIDISDSLAILPHLFLDDSRLGCLDAADPNDASSGSEGIRPGGGRPPSALLPGRGNSGFDR